MFDCFAILDSYNIMFHFSACCHEVIILDLENAVIGNSGALCECAIRNCQLNYTYLITSYWLSTTILCV